VGPAEHPRTLAGWPVRHSRGGRGARECEPIPVGISRRISCAQPHLTCAAHRGDSRAGKFGSRSRTTWAGCGWWRESPTGICSPPSHPAETWSWSMEAQRQHNPGLQRADGDAQETPTVGCRQNPSTQWHRVSLRLHFPRHWSRFPTLLLPQPRRENPC